MTAVTLPDLLAGFQRSAWRLEARDTYMIAREAPQLAAFERDGTPPPPATAWYDTIGSARERGATIGRIRLVGHPITPYTWFEFAAYPGNLAAGEDIRVVDRAWLDESWDDAPDVWVFDGVTAAVMNYTENGEWLGVDLVDGRPYQQLRLQLEPLSIRLDEYQLGDIPVPRPAGGNVSAPRLPSDIAAQ